jgi:hypothetical protein
VKQSESIGKLAAALTAAHAEITAVAKDATNPHFKNKYASLDTILAHVRPILTKHGLALVQGMTTPHADEHGVMRTFCVETMLLHSSGEFMTNAAIMPVVKHDPQGVGGALTYGRRYGVSALLSIATEEDDDGNGSGQRPMMGGRKSRDVGEHRTPVRTDDAQGDSPTEKQTAFLARLMQSHVFTDAERRKVEVQVTSKQRAKDAIEWAQAEMAKRKEAEAA